VVQRHAAEFVAEGTKTPQELAAEEAMAGERLMRQARQEGGYYSRPEVGREVTVTPKERVVWCGEDRYIDCGAGTEVVTQGTVMEANDRRLAALPAERVRKFEAVFGEAA
jgi:hypothetical protein